MKTIVNLLPVSTGGGLQNALSLISGFKDANNYIFIVRKDSDTDKLCQKFELETLSVGNSNWQRFIFELSVKRRFKKGMVCFTLFGPVMLSASGHLTNVVGCAYSNLFYPTIPFWGFLSPLQKLRKEGIDLLRKHMTQKADYWIFETKALRDRAVELCGFPENRVSVVRMAPSKLVSKNRVDNPQSDLFNKHLYKTFRILYLSGAHPNKRLHLLPEIAEEMVRAGFDDFCFVTTMDESSSYARLVIDTFEKKGIGAHLVNLGTIPSEQVPTVIDVCDVMCTLSVLESFSNNFVESWQMQKPLVVTDADWSRDSCGDAALYVDPTDAAAAAHALINIATAPDLQKKLVDYGCRQLSSYNTPESKLHEYLHIIERARGLGPLSKSERNRIHWP